MSHSAFLLLGYGIPALLLLAELLLLARRSRQATGPAGPAAGTAADAGTESAAFAIGADADAGGGRPWRHGDAP